MGYMGSWSLENMRKAPAREGTVVATGGLVRYVNILRIMEVRFLSGRGGTCRHGKKLERTLWYWIAVGCTGSQWEVNSF